ncbi:hypothetical protein KO494_14905 [Lacinutrix sp. C3R15]|uniref:hypothetical protein n=1 Tax=Flavobacteriaceae TaxID=49546 RepID=UPI001C0955EA|nr:MULTISPECIES: hypothetical protein [Flavobacteriaceae]MBU2940836.1 hypothetical protein [Lacinutrix sp. C3R15]MDO6624154.1 hypothetical protein [Oceanihabitans sp. 1_MG-2023]
MLVFPQTFNYRLIIGTLVIVITVLGSYSISYFNSFKNQEEFLEQEKNLVQNELKEMISLYEDVFVENQVVKTKLETSKTKVESILNLVKNTKTDVSLISKYKSQIHTLKKEREGVFGHIDSLVRNNNILQSQVDSVSQQFESQKLELDSLVLKNKKLYKIINEVGMLKANHIKVAALNTSSSLRFFETNKASKTDYFEVCTTLESNAYTNKGSKNIYVQIVDVNDEIISERGVLKFEEKHIAYSGKTTVKNVSDQVTACLKISLKNKEMLKAGTYDVNIFQNATFLGNTSITLK